jgi:hypothetical protein
MVLLFGGGVIIFSFEYSLDSSLHLPFMDFVTQFMRCELFF